MSELKPCPFCGGKAIELEGDGKWTQIGCNSCQAKGTEYPAHLPKAIAAWNRRAPEAGHEESVCPACHGSGEFGFSSNACPTCKGTGEYKSQAQAEPNRYIERNSITRACGFGYIAGWNDGSQGKLCAHGSANIDRILADADIQIEPAVRQEPVAEEERFKQWLSASKYYQVIRGLSVNEQQIAWDAWQARSKLYAQPQRPAEFIEVDGIHVNTEWVRRMRGQYHVMDIKLQKLEAQRPAVPDERRISIQQFAFERGGTDDGQYVLDNDDLQDLIEYTLENGRGVPDGLAENIAVAIFGAGNEPAKEVRRIALKGHNEEDFGGLNLIALTRVIQAALTAAPAPERPEE